MPAPTLAVVKSPVYKHKTLIISFLSLTKQQHQQQHKKPQNNDKKQTNKKHSPKTPKTPTKNKQQKQLTNKNNNLITTTNRTTNYHFTTLNKREREREMFYLTTHSTHFIYGYMASDIWLRTILIVKKETRCRHIGYSYRLTARVLLYAPSHRQDNTYHGLCYTSRG